MTVLIAKYQLQWFLRGRKGYWNLVLNVPYRMCFSATHSDVTNLIAASTAVVHPGVCWSAWCTSPFSLLT